MFGPRACEHVHCTGLPAPCMSEVCFINTETRTSKHRIAVADRSLLSPAPNYLKPSGSFNARHHATGLQCLGYDHVNPFQVDSHLLPFREYHILGNLVDTILRVDTRASRPTATLESAR